MTTKTPGTKTRRFSVRHTADSKIQRALAVRRLEAMRELQALRCVDCGRVGAHECPPHAA